MIFLGLTIIAPMRCLIGQSAFGQIRPGAGPPQAIGDEVSPSEAGEPHDLADEPEGPSTEERTSDRPKTVRMGDTKIIPSIAFSQRYDSNVLFVPSGTQIDLTRWDFVTSVNPKIQITNGNRYAVSSVTAGVNGSVFVNNSDLNFVSSSVTGTTALDRSLERLIHGAKLQISNTFAFSPESPSFTSPADPVPTDNPFARGLVPLRANIYTNTALVAAAYPLSSRFVIQGNYSYSFLRVGEVLVKQPITAPVVFFNTDQQAWSLGPTWRVSRTDSFSVFYRSTRTSLAATSGAIAATDFTAQGVEGTYSTSSAERGAIVSGGATILDLDNRAYWTGSLTLYAKYGEATNVRVTGSRAFAPAFFVTGGALISTTTGLSIDYRFSRLLMFTGGANYAHNETAPQQFATFDTYGVSGLLSYNISRSLATSIGYAYTYFEVGAPASATSPLAGYVVNRHVVTFSLIGTWQ